MLALLFSLRRLMKQAAVLVRISISLPNIITETFCPSMRMPELIHYYILPQKLPNPDLASTRNDLLGSRILCLLIGVRPCHSSGG
jgi:hypothetical protein